MKNKKLLNKLSSGMAVRTANVNLNNWIFIHIPKNAGTSITKVLKHKVKIAGHNRASEFPNLKKIAFTRNPYNRLVSAYWYVKQNRSGTKQRDKDLHKAVCQYKNQNEFALNFWKHPIIREYKHFKLQSYFADTNIDFIGKVETINQDFNKLCSILKISAGLPKLNSASLPNNQLTLHGSAKKCVYDYYYNDFNLYGYGR